MVHFPGTEYRSHTSCISEAQKYQGHLYKGEKEKKGKGPAPKGANGQAVVPRKAYVEDELEDGRVVAVADVPPKAPSPPPAADVDVFDYLVTDETPKASKSAATAPVSKDAPHYKQTNGRDADYLARGYTYGAGPLDAADESQSSYVTPASKRERSSGRQDKDKSDKKRKRHELDGLDTSQAQHSHDEAMGATPHVLHSGLTGGLDRLLSRPSDYSADAMVPSPVSPIKRSKHDRSEGRDEQRQRPRETHKSTTRHELVDDDRARRRKHRHRDSSSSDEARRPSRKQQKAIDYRTASAEPTRSNQIVTYRSPAELFLSFVTKGPESEKGCSVNKALKRYHRECDNRGDRDEGDKDLWKELRVRRNERGEFVLFV